MIIKFKTRTGKQSIYSSKQICSYILQNKNRDVLLYDETTLFQNMDFIIPKEIHKSFLQNFWYIKKHFRSNGISLNHTVLSIHTKDREHVTTEMLIDLRDTFIKMAGISDTVLLSKAHRSEKDQNIHIHILYSHNKYRSKKRVRMTTRKMKSLLISFEEFHLKAYPMLKYSKVYTLEKNRSRLEGLTDRKSEDRNTRKEKEFQVLRRYKQEGRGRKTKKEIVSERVRGLFDGAKSIDEVITRLQKEPDIFVYTIRNQVRGVVVNNIKYKFKTLQLENELERLERYQSRLKQLKLIREMAKGRSSRGLGRGL